MGNYGCTSLRTAKIQLFSIQAEKIVKIFSVCVIVLVTFRGFLNDNFVWVINGGTYGEVYYNSHDYLQSFLRWGMLVATVVFPCACFFTKKTIFKTFFNPQPSPAISSHNGSFFIVSFSLLG